MTSSSRNAFGLLILRVGSASLLLFAHGWPKLTHFADRAGQFSDPLHVGSTASLTLVVFAEVFCSALVAVGLFTRWAVVPILIFLLVAGFIQHAADPWARKELAFVYLVAFLPLLFTGAGRFSIDALISKRRSAEQPDT